MKVLTMIVLVLVSFSVNSHHQTPCLKEGECKCVTAECAAGLPPADPHILSCNEICNGTGSVVCLGIAAKARPKKRQEVFRLCQVHKTATCVAACTVKGS